MDTSLPIEQAITFLYTANLDRTAAFYESIIGLTLWRDQGTCRIYRVSSDGLLGFCQRDVPESAAGPGEDRVIFTIVTSDVDGWYERLRQRGVTFSAPPRENPTYRIYHCFLRDPNGYLIEIQRFLD